MAVGLSRSRSFNWIDRGRTRWCRRDRKDRARLFCTRRRTRSLMQKNTENQPGGEILLYQTEDGRTRIECRFEDNTLWLSQTVMAVLFQSTFPNFKLHIKNSLSEGEPTEAATIKDYLIV